MCVYVVFRLKSIKVGDSCRNLCGFFFVFEIFTKCQLVKAAKLYNFQYIIYSWVASVSLELLICKMQNATSLQLTTGVPPRE
jgi:hypothetical protein